ncbi:MAG: sigma 54-interacting transcriptional regulator [Desulfobacterales bacterium]|nr:sigma 54-interacting transcriptional regulator [Desulfobacterales bacterium]
MRLKSELIFIDRVGIVADISALLASFEMSIHSMEVVQTGDHALVYVAFETSRRNDTATHILERLSRIKGLEQIRLVETLPYEERENRFKVLFDNMSDGVFSIDADCCLKTINRIALKALDLDADRDIGRDIRALDLPDLDIIGCLNGRKYTDVKKSLVSKGRRFRYLATGRPIRDAAGGIIGAMEIAKGLSEIERMARSITESKNISFSDIIGQSRAMIGAIDFAQKIAPTDAVVALRGDSGTGKELFARAIHSASGRNGSFVAINCAALPEQLLESELFGYVDGAFTGGRKGGKPGLFELAEKGTLFLDEIAEMPMASQAKILRALQDRQVRRIGGMREIPYDARLITATNRDLEILVKKKVFRNDLYYRINVLPIHLPPLTQRRDDIPLLVEHFLFDLSSKLERSARCLSPRAMEKMIDYAWPGNVRELKHVVERAHILCETDVIGEQAVLFGSQPEMWIADCRLPEEASKDTPLRVRMDTHERRILVHTLERAASIREAARRLGISHPTLLAKMKKHELQMVRNITTGRKNEKYKTII